MPNWEGIEDAATMLPQIWLTRAGTGDVWKPLRKVDCKALNESRGENIMIDGGRATADPQEGIIKFNFINRPDTKLMSATWFSREEKSNKEFILHPLPDGDSLQVEMLYQNAVHASSTLGEGIEEILKEEIVLESDPDFKIFVSKQGGGGLLSMKKRPKSSNFFSFGDTSTLLQRGYGQYSVYGEDDENILGNVNHVCFVIHGIGEAMWSRADVSRPSMCDELDILRSTMYKKKLSLWKEECKKCEKMKQSLPPLPHRVEFVPIEWYSKIRSPNDSLMTSLNAVTLRSIPALRSIANDVIFDVLMYLTPEYCETILECVTSQIIEMYSKFQRVHPDFVSRGGKCSLIGHSLGSVICWDILSILKENIESNRPKGNRVDPICVDADAEIANDKQTSDMPFGYKGYDGFAKSATEDGGKYGSWGPSLPKRMTKTLPFTPSLAVFLGSPVGLFLTLRGAHGVFDEMRAIAEAERASLIPLDSDDHTPPPVFDVTPVICSPFSLPCEALYNIFHPSDPIAYRIEPLLLPEGVGQHELPPPVFLSPDGKGVRLHVKANQFIKSFGAFSFNKVVENAANAAAYSDAPAAAESKEKKAPTSKFEGSVRDREVSFALGGRKSRVDYALQPGVVDNEYLSAVTAHASYFNHDDVIDFLIFNTRHLS